MKFWILIKNKTQLGFYFFYKLATKNFGNYNMNMKNFILHITLLALIIYFAIPEFIDGISIDSGKTALVTALLFAFINFTIKPIINVITLPLNVLSLGLFGFLVNILLFWFVGSIIDGFVVTNFAAAALGAVALTISNWILDKLLH
jgi:putative membrane protein